ncbi:MAG: deoxyribose-phosphate aldolase [Clostridiales bacterium]|nr:deoxyribose-phosphate aldolase [Clostridiales bacterium]
MNVSKYIDHTVLKAETKEVDVKRYCSEAKEHSFFSVCVNSSYVELVAKELKNSDVKVTAVVGFPLGASTSETKAFETKDAIKKGANEIDMVINVGALKDKRFDYVLNDIKAVVDAADKKAIVKVIIEASLLNFDEKKKACHLAKEAKADFVKTSTGFSTGGATIEDIKLMRGIVGSELGVKASGGIRDYETAIKMINAGASRLGCSASVSIVTGAKENNSTGY